MHGTRACMNNANAASDLRLDKRALRVLAHPLRSRLLTELRLNGPAFATARYSLNVTTAPEALKTPVVNCWIRRAVQSARSRTSFTEVGAPDE